MNKRYNSISFAYGIPGIVLQTAGLFIEQPLVLLLGTVLLLVGLGYYAEAKGRSPVWCLMGLLSIIGLIILACLKDLEKESTQKPAMPSQGRSQGNFLDQLEELAQLKEKGILTEEEFQSQKSKLLSQ